MRNPNPIAKDNLKKYGKPPTWEQIESLIKESGISSIYNFEAYYGMSFNHLAKVKYGLKPLGRAYWHFFYQRIIPERGAAFYAEKKLTKKLPKKILKVIPANKCIANDSESVAYLPDNTTSVVDIDDNSLSGHDRTGTLK